MCALVSISSHSMGSEEQFGVNGMLLILQSQGGTGLWPAAKGELEPTADLLAAAGQTGEGQAWQQLAGAEFPDVR